VKLPYNVMDFRACAKHAYYGASKDEGIHCEKTDRRFATWQTGAADFLTRYVIPVLDGGGSPREMIVAHDFGRDYRTGIYPDYKGQKSKKDENKSPVEIEQYGFMMDWAKKFLRNLGVTQLAVKGVEADDLMAWIRQMVKGPMNIHTVDQDMLQLVDDDTIVYLKGAPHFGADGTYDDTHDLAGLPYYLTSFAKSIVGDPSDNYGGVKGLGPKKIRDLREAFGDDGLLELQAIVASGNTTELDAAIEETGNKILIKLRESFGEWRTGWKLANLKPELCWKPRQRKLTKLTIDKRVPNPQRLYDLLADIGALDLWSHFEPVLPAPLMVDANNWADMKAAIFAEIEAGDKTAFDYESSDKDPIPGFRMASASGNSFVDALSQELAGASFQFGRHMENVIYVPVDHKDSANVNKLVVLEILEHAEKHTQLIAHNAHFEGVVTQTNLGKRLKNVHDTRMMQRFYDENTPAGLKFLSLNYLGYEQASFEDTLAAGNGGLGVNMMCELTADETFTYGTDDSLVTGHLHDLLELLLKLDGQWDFYSRWAVRPTEVLQRSYICGVNMNWAQQKRLHAADLKTIEEGMVELRQILLENVTGNITEGCLSLIEAEKDYIFRSAKKKADGNTEVATQKLVEWRKKLEASCQYTPYREEKIMPTFAFTPTQLNPAMKNLGLPEFESLSQKAFNQWLEAAGAVGYEENWELNADQVAMVKLLAKAINLGCLKMGDLRKKTEDGGNAAEQALLAAESHMEVMADIVQRAAGVEPRIVTFGDPLNVGSPAQMQQLLYCKIGVPVKLRGKQAGKGRLAVGIQEAGPSTDEQAILTAIANDVKLQWQRDALDVLRKVKTATTRCSLYHDKYPLWRHRDGRVHPYITDYGTDTGRPTGSAPNILQVPKKGAGKAMRSIYVPPNRDYLCVAIDFNGQEIRIMANLAKDPVMLSVYDPENEKDLHSMTGSGIAKMDYLEFCLAKDSEDHPMHKLCIAIRGKAKTINFGMAYGAGAGTLSRNLIAPLEEAKQLLEQTMKLYWRIRPWQEESAKFMETHGYTLTAYGSKRHATADIFHKDNGKVARQHRQGTNAQIQGTGADMLRIVLTRVAESDMLDRLRMEFFAPVYDEIVSWVHKDDVLAYCQEMGKYMEESTPPDHVVRQVPEFSIGADWGRVHELGRDISPKNVQEYVDLALWESGYIWNEDMLEPFDPITKYTLVELDEDEEVELDVVD
jgi:DNA polymerase I-like protein with 3'-5' exonuclease and polymerase domains/5'-3' exonuclease